MAKEEVGEIDRVVIEAEVCLQSSYKLVMLKLGVDMLGQGTTESILSPAILTGSYPSRIRHVCGGRRHSNVVDVTQSRFHQITYLQDPSFGLRSLTTLRLNDHFLRDKQHSKLPLFNQPFQTRLLAPQDFNVDTSAISHAMPTSNLEFPRTVPNRKCPAFYST